MTKNLAPRFHEPIVAALMGAGFFIFVSVLTGGPFWRSLEESLWRRFQGRSFEAPAQAILIKGSGHEALSLVQRRALLAKDIALLSAAGAKAVFLEAWLDESSQAESAGLLADLLDSTKSLPKKSAHSVQRKVASLKAQLNTDANLAAAMQAAGNVVLPVVAEPSHSQAGLTGTVWAKLRPYQVVVKGKGARKLDGFWRVVRAPLELFRDSCQSLALVPPPQNFMPESAQELQAIFQVRGHWVNGLGFEAARMGLELPSKALQFVWREGRLAAVEMRGARYPVTERGGIWLPPQRDRAQIETFESFQLEGSPLLKSLKGRIVFFQPWPGLLVGEQAFAQQHELAAGLLARKVQAKPEGSLETWFALGLWIVAVAAILWAPAAMAAALLLLLAAADFWLFHQGLAPLARPLGMLGAATLSAAGLKLLMLRRKREERQFWLRGHVAAPAHARWQKLLPDPLALNSVHGAYLALRLQEPCPAHRWALWAERAGVFYEHSPGDFPGFVVPLEIDQVLPLALIQDLRRLLPGAAMAFSRGTIQFEAEKVLDHVRWNVSGSPKSEALTMLEAAKPGFLVVSESDYVGIRQNVKIQLLGGLPGQGDALNKKIFNIIEIF